MDAKTTATATELADLLNIPVRTLHDLTRRAVIPKAARNEYKLHASVHAYLAYLTSTVDEDDARVKTARASKLESEAALAAIDLRKAESKVIPVEQATAVVTGIATQVRSGMLAVPSRISARLPHLSRADIAIIRDEIREALTALSNADPDETFLEKRTA